MVLNNLSQQFCIYFQENFFYPEVRDRWLPVVKKQMLPYMSLEDYMNAQITTVNFPALNMQSVQQQFNNYKLNKRSGFQTDMSMEKSLTITFKLTEGYVSYFILRHQFDLYYKMGNKMVKPLYWPSIMVDILDDFGHAIVTYQEEQITPEGLSDISLSYAARLGSFNTFTLSLRYNYWNIWYMNSVTGKGILETY